MADICVMNCEVGVIYDVPVITRNDSIIYYPLKYLGDDIDGFWFVASNGFKFHFNLPILFVKEIDNV